MDEYRLDVYLQTNNLASSREKSKQLIKNSCVFVNDILITKCSYKVSINDKIEVKNNSNYVGRGALKIEKAIKLFNINPTDKVAVDIGASTGGFTDYLLKHNAKKVYAVDVGHGQLHEDLRANKKVVNLEKTNFRHIDTSVFIEDIDIIVVDVSFISLKLILPKISEISNDNTEIVILIKPQFEAGRHNIGKNGIIKDKSIHLEVLNNIVEYLSENNFSLINVTNSPIKGGDGNIEYLGYLKKVNKLLKTEHKFKDLINKAFE